MSFREIPEFSGGVAESDDPLEGWGAAGEEGVRMRLVPISLILLFLAAPRGILPVLGILLRGRELTCISVFTSPLSIFFF